ncbi:MAG: hypothetical protein AAGF79_07170 [Pseudomonadota bacterium]
MPSTLHRSDSAIAISLFRDLETGQWLVSRLDLSFGNVQHQVRFRAATPLEQTFCAAFVDRLRGYLPHRPDPAVLSNSNATFRLQNAILQGLRVISTRAMDGCQSVVVRFTRALGQLTSILAPQYRPDHQLPETHADQIAAATGDQNRGDAQYAPGLATPETGARHE